MNPEWGKLFISYYKSLMTYKIKDLVLIAKLLDLLIVYGVRIIRIVVSRILKIKETDILTDVERGPVLLGYLGTDIIMNYFSE